MTGIAAIFRKEFLLNSRRRWLYFKRFAVVGAAAAILFYGFITQRLLNSTQMGLVIFRYLGVLVVVLACFLTPYAAAYQVFQERESRTLDLLYLANIAAAPLAFGKLFSVMASSLIAVLSVAPMVILTVSMGGIATAQVLMALAVLAAAIFLGACLGLLVAAVARSEVQLQGFTWTASLLLFGLPPLMIGAWASPAWRQPLACSFSPLAAMLSLIEGKRFDLAAVGCATDLVLGLPLLALAVYLLPRQALSTMSAAAGRAPARRALADTFGRAPGKDPILGGNPVLWKDLHVSYGGPLAVFKQFAAAALASIAVGAGLHCMLLLRGAKSSLLLAICTCVAATSGAVYFFSASTRFVRSFSHEQQAGTLGLLLTTDLSDHQIVTGKVDAVSLSLLPWLLGFLAATAGAVTSWWVFQARFGAREAMWAFIFLGNSVAMLSAFSYVAAYMSLRLRRGSTVFSVIGLLLWYLLGNTVFLVLATVFSVFTFGLALFVVPFAAPVLVGGWFRGLLIQDFRRLVLDEGRRVSVSAARPRE